MNIFFFFLKFDLLFCILLFIFLFFDGICVYSGDKGWDVILVHLVSIAVVKE